MKLIAVLVLVLAGCTSIDYNHHIDGWPELKVETHIVSSEVMHAHCDQYAGWGTITLACSEYFLTDLICKIWVTVGGGWEEAHERGHCAGYDHPGSDSMKDILARNNKQQEKNHGSINK